MTGWCARARRFVVGWRGVAACVWLCWFGAAFAQQVPVDLAWQPVVAGAALPADAAWQRIPTDRIVPVAAAPTGAWLRLSPVAATWPDDGLAVELRLRALGSVSLVDARGATVLTVSVDTPRPGLVRGHGVTLVPVPRLADRAATILLRLDARATSEPRIDVVVRTTADEMTADARRLAFISACLAVLLVTAVYALLFAFVMRDITYLHYAAYVLGFAGIQLLVTGYAVDLLELRGAAALRPWLIAFGVGASSWGAAHFMDGFVDLPRYAPFASRALRWVAHALVGVCAVSLLPLPFMLQLLRTTINPLLIALAVVMLAASLLALARGSRYVRFYLFGWLPLLAVTIVDSAQSLGAFAQWTRVSDAMLAAGTFETVVLVFAITFRARDLRGERDRTRHMAETDGLTGVLNRRGWQHSLDAVLMRAQQRREPEALLYLDIDHFKAFNDRHGHACGDQLLVAVARAIGLELRPGDLLGRYGGEEFVVLLPGCDDTRAHATAERVRACVERLRVPVQDGTAGATISIGISAIGPGEAPQAAVERADAAMYASKRSGRNRASAG